MLPVSQLQEFQDYWKVGIWIYLWHLGFEFGLWDLRLGLRVCRVWWLGNLGLRLWVLWGWEAGGSSVVDSGLMVGGWVECCGFRVDGSGVKV